MGGPAGRGRSTSSLSANRAWIWRHLGRRPAGRCWSPLSDDEKPDVSMHESTATAVVSTECQMKLSPMPANCESRPTVRSMKKNKTDHRGEMGSLDRASGYAMNARPNPAQRQHDVRGLKTTSRILSFYSSLQIRCLCLTFFHHLSNRHLVEVSHVAQDWKYGKSCKNTGAWEKLGGEKKRLFWWFHSEYFKKIKIKNLPPRCWEQLCSYRRWSEL